MLVNTSYYDHAKYIWFMSGNVNHFKVIFKWYVNGAIAQGAVTNKRPTGLNCHLSVNNTYLIC